MSHAENPGEDARGGWDGERPFGGVHSLPALMAGDRPDLELCTGCTGGR
jgi:hypothetical protein